MTATDAEQTAAHFLRRKALAILREERLTIIMVECHSDRNAVDTVIAQVKSSRSSGGLYRVDLLENKQWTCTCRADAVCPHIRAAQIVTGHTPA